MNRKIPQYAIAALASAMLVGCTSNEYNPPSQDTQLSAHAASVKYPTEQAKALNQVTATVNKSRTQITLSNFGDKPLVNFNLWVNSKYVLHVNRLGSRSVQTYKASDLFDDAGTSLAANSAATIQQVQVETSDGALWNVQGPLVLQ